MSNMRSSTLIDMVKVADRGDNLEVRIEHKQSMGDHEEHGDILIERVVTPDYIRITRIYKVMPDAEKRRDSSFKRGHPNQSRTEGNQNRNDSAQVQRKESSFNR